MLETTKNTVIARPTCVKVRPNSAMSHGNSGGIMKWKKCDVPCANPTSEITVASWRRLVAGEAADMVGALGTWADSIRSAPRRPLTLTAVKSP